MKLSKQYAPPVEGLSIESLMELLFYREEFLTIASHELKTPITSLKLHAQVFKRDSKRNKNTHYEKAKVDALVEQMESQANRLGKLVDSMIDVSRIRSGQFHFIKEYFNLSDMVRMLLTSFECNYPDTQFKFILKNNIHYHGDKKRIEQVIFNIIDNAIKYGKSLPITVTLELKRKKIFLTISDLGYGMVEEDKERIFYQFQRAIPASEVSGLGLGLFIANEITRAHGGKILVESEIGKGSTFTVVLTAGDTP